MIAYYDVPFAKLPAYYSAYMLPAQPTLLLELLVPVEPYKLDTIAISNVTACYRIPSRCHLSSPPGAHTRECAEILNSISRRVLQVTLVVSPRQAIQQATTVPIGMLCHHFTIRHNTQRHY